MKQSVNRFEGLLEIQHAGPGITEEMVRASGLDAPAVGAHQTGSFATFKCCGCGGQVWMNKDRRQAREWCSNHNAHMCDNCGLQRKLGHEHKGIQKIFDEAVVVHNKLLTRGF